MSDLSKPPNYFQTVQMKRRIDNTWAQPGCKGQALFNVPLESVLPDELVHLLLCITDRLGGLHHP